VPCGGHAWSTDGLTWSNLTIGGFGPVIRFANGSYWVTAYVERPQVVLDDAGRPLAFYVGMGRNSYEDSCTWAQLFCQPGQQGCGPTVPPSPIAVRYQRSDGQCLVTNTSFPCPGGWGDSCPLTLGACTSATAVWYEQQGGTVSSVAITGAVIDVDCNSAAPGTVTKALVATGGAAVLSFNASAGTIAFGSTGMCLNDGSGTPVPPCRGGEFYVDDQVKLTPCGASDAAGWQRVVVPGVPPARAASAAAVGESE